MLLLFFSFVSKEANSEGIKIHVAESQLLTSRALTIISYDKDQTKMIFMTRGVKDVNLTPFNNNFLIN